MIYLFKRRWRNKTSKKILAVGGMTGSCNAIIPVVKELSKESDLELVVVSCEKTAERAFTKEKVPYRTQIYYVDSSVSTNLMHNIINEEKPQLVLTGASFQTFQSVDVADQVVRYIARELNIPSIALMDSWMTEVERFSDVYDKENGRYKFMANMIGVLDKIGKARMIEKGFSEEKLRIVGNPTFDSLAKFAEEWKPKVSEVREELGLQENDVVVLYASDIASDLKDQGWGFTDLECLEVLLKGINKLGDSREKVVLYIKKHPREKQENFDLLLNLTQKYDVRHFTKSYDTKKAVLAADLAVAPASTVLIEATLMGVNALSLQPGSLKKEEFLPNVIDAIPHSYYAEEGIDLVVDILSPDSVVLRNYSEKKNQLKVDGKATERAVNLVKEMLS